MCSGGDCPQKENCIRFTGAVYGRQDFFGTPPYDVITGACNSFIDDRPSNEAVRVQAYNLWQEAGCPDGRHVEFWLSAEAYLLNLRRNGA